MKRLSSVLLFIFITGARPARAQVSTDAPILTMMLSEDKVFHSFMQLQVVQEIATLKANYDASVRYFNDFKQLNSGKGLFQNIGAQIKTAQQQEDYKIQQELNQTFIKTRAQRYDTNTAVDKFYKALNQGVDNNIKYAGDEFANLIANRQTGQDIASNANGLAPKDAANLSAKAQGVQVQMLTQIHEDNLRLIQLQSMQLAAEARRQQGDATSIQDLQSSLQKRYPNAQVQPQAQTEDGQ